MALQSTKFHLSLNVSNLTRSVAFYRVLFGLEPAKVYEDYAKFELVEPPVVFSLVPQASLAGGSLSKIGLRLANEAAVADLKERVEAAGFATQVPPGCCTGTLKKMYVADPDLNFWEIATGADDGSPAMELPQVAPAPVAAAAGPVVWEHFITAPLPEFIPHDDGTVDEVRLTGTFNAVLAPEHRQQFLRDAYRVLKAGGKVVVHGLVGDKPFSRQPQLPGLASMVQHVPLQTEPLEALRAAGFAGGQFTKFSEKAWFQIDGAELREIKLVALKPEPESQETRQVIYRGPFAEAMDDAGNVYLRGRRVTVNAAVADSLSRSAAVEQFLFVKQDALGTYGA
ncbi:MAG: VOC family protein [Gemmataceae bacterium]|nr:VOC family protein [Gemmataceae bacterium]